MSSSNLPQKIIAEADSVCGIGRIFIPQQTDAMVIDNLIITQQKSSQSTQNDSSSNVSLNIVQDNLLSLKSERQDVNKLRALILHIPSQENESSHQILAMKVIKNRNESSTPKFLFNNVSFSWESEVKTMMRTENSDYFLPTIIEEDETNTATTTNASNAVNASNTHSSIESKKKDDMIAENMIANEFLVPSVKLPEKFVKSSYFYDDMIDSIDLNNMNDELEALIPNVNTIHDSTTHIHTNNIALHENRPLFIPPEPILSNNTISNSDETTTNLNTNKPAPKSITGNKELTAAERRKLLAEEKKKRLMNVSLGTEAVKSLDKIFGSKNRYDDFTVTGKRRGRSIISSLNHTNIALSHRNTKPDLKEIELRYFHRPHIMVQVSFTIIVKSELDSHKQKSKATASSGSSSTGSGAGNASNPNSMPMPITLPRKDLVATQLDRQNISLVDGSVIIMEYIEERPPIIQNIGMASAIINYTINLNTEENENDETVESSGTNSNSNSNLNTNSSLTSNNNSNNKKDSIALRKSKMWSLIDTYRLPRHVVLLLRQRENKVLNSALENSFAPIAEIGERMLLPASDESPFLASITPGEAQSAIVNNLFKGPIYKQEESLSYDYLLVPMNDKKSVKYILRSIPKIYTIGQTEPQKVVPRPVQRITELQEKFYLLAAARYFSMDMSLNGIEYSKIQNLILKYCAKELRSPHKSHHREKLKLIISKVAYESKDGNIMKWYPKDFYEIAENIMNGDEMITGAELERMYSEEELAKGFTSEDVCLQESCNAYEYELYELGITKDIELSMLEEWIQRMYRLIKFREEQYIQIKSHKQRLQNLSKEIGSSVSSSQQSQNNSSNNSNSTSINNNNNNNNFILSIQNSNRMLKIQMNELKKLYDTTRVGEYIFHRLLIAPWNTTEAYYNCIIEKENSKSIGSGVMDITADDCDPSGIGEGFSYKYIVKPLVSKPIGNKSQDRLQGTDKDLRKLTNTELVTMLSNLGVSKEDIKKLNRWDRVHLLRDLMNQTSAGGLVPNALKKFVRNEGVFGSALNESLFKKRCQEIWDRQKRSLEYFPSLNHRYDLIELINGTIVSDMKTNDVEDLEKTIERSLQVREDEKILLQTDGMIFSNSSNSSISSSSSSSLQGIQNKNREDKLVGQEILQELSSVRGSGPPVPKILTRIIGGFNLSSSSSSNSLSSNVIASSVPLSSSSMDTSSSIISSNSSQNVENIQSQSQSFENKDNMISGDNHTSSRSNMENITSISTNMIDTNTTNPMNPVNITLLRPKPSKVVKRVTRILHDDGNKITESIKVEFIVSELEVRKVEDRTIQERKLRQLKRSNPILLSSRQRGVGNRHMSFDEDLLDDSVDHNYLTSSGTLGINFGALKRKASEAMALDNSYDDRYGEDAYLRQQYRSTKRSNSLIPKNSRLPRVELAARFEKEILDIWDMKKASLFRFPVPREVVGYYDMITNPICLTDIRERITEYYYTTAKSLFDDMVLLAENAEKFNGKLSDISKNGWKLVNKLKRGLSHDRDHFGPEGDTIRILEEAIQKKEMYSKRSGLHQKTHISHSSHSLSQPTHQRNQSQASNQSNQSNQSHSSNPSIAQIQIQTTIPGQNETTSGQNVAFRSSNTVSITTTINQGSEVLNKEDKKKEIHANVSSTSKMMSMLDDDDDGEDNDSSGDEEILEEG